MNMKRIFALAFAVLMVLALAACGTIIGSCTARHMHCVLGGAKRGNNGFR